MKTISLAEFEALVARKDWVSTQGHEVISTDTHYRNEEFDNETQELTRDEVAHSWGWIAKTSRLDGATITYNELFSYDKYNSDSLSINENPENVWTMEGVTVLDDGVEIEAHALADHLPEDSDFKAIDYNALNIDQIDDIDVDEDSDMETFTLTIDNAPDIRFTGELIGSAKSSSNNATGSSYSGQTGRWTELSLYKTVGGKLICHQIGRTQWASEKDRFSGKVCSTVAEVIEFFGNRWLAKELYEDAGIESIIEVE